MVTSHIYEQPTLVPINQTAALGVGTSTPETFAALHAQCEQHWGPEPLPIRAISTHDPFTLKSVLRRRRYGALRVLGVAMNKINARDTVVQCNCRRYGIVRSSRLYLGQLLSCAMCNIASANASPMFSAYSFDAPPRRLIPEIAQLKQPGPVIVVGMAKETNAYIFFCKDCGSYRIRKKQKVGVCGLCRTYVTDPSARTYLPDWWPVRKNVLAKLDILSEAYRNGLESKPTVT